MAYNIIDSQPYCPQYGTKSINAPTGSIPSLTQIIPFLRLLVAGYQSPFPKSHPSDHNPQSSHRHGIPQAGPRLGYSGRTSKEEGSPGRQVRTQSQQSLQAIEESRQGQSRFGRTLTFSFPLAPQLPSPRQHRRRRNPLHMRLRHRRRQHRLLRVVPLLAAHRVLLSELCGSASPHLRRLCWG
jgi:hypothetical protein